MDDSFLPALKTEIADLLGVDESLIVPDARFIADLDADSLDCVELLIIVETKFDCQISDEEAEKMITFGDLIALVQKKTRGKPNPN
jgi:acyl carrier protein